MTEAWRDGDRFKFTYIETLKHPDTYIGAPMPENDAHIEVANREVQHLKSLLRLMAKYGPAVLSEESLRWCLARLQNHLPRYQAGATVYKNPVENPKAHLPREEGKP